MLSHDGLYLRKRMAEQSDHSFLLLIYGKDSRSRLSFLAIELLGNDRPSRTISHLLLTFGLALGEHTFMK